MAVATSSRLPLAERLRPVHLDDIVGNPRARYELRTWAEEWASGRTPARRAAVLMGPPGVGKTTAAVALAEDFGWTLVEMNASDARNEVAVEQVAGRASVSHTLDAGASGRRAAHALILLDEADCLTGRLTETSQTRPTPPSLAEFLRGRYGSIDALNAAWGLVPKGKPKPFEAWSSLPRSPGNAGWARLPAARRDLDEWKVAGRTSDLSDRGGLGAITRLARSTRQPIVLTVNDDRSLTRYSSIFRNGVARIRFYPVRDSEMSTFVERTARSEHIQLHPGVLELIVKRAHGDVRAALNDLDAIAPLTTGEWQLSVLGFRDLGADLVALTDEALSRPRYYRSVEIQDRLDAPPDDLLPWIEENLPAFSPDARHRDNAFRVLAVAEQFLARARRARIWGLWSYASEVMTGGVSFALHDAPIHTGGSGVSFPSFLGEMGQSRAIRSVRDALAKRTGRHFHLSTAKSREFVVPFLESVLRAGTARGALPATRSAAKAISRELELTAEEVAYLLEVPVDSRAVADLTSPPAPVEEEVAPTAEPDRPAPVGSKSEPARKVQRQLSDFGGG